MTDEQKQPEEQKRTIMIDPSKFTISEDGQVVVTDPAFAEALRAASLDEENQGHGGGVGIGVVWAA